MDGSHRVQTKGRIDVTFWELLGWSSNWQDRLHKSRGVSILGRVAGRNEAMEPRDTISTKPLYDCAILNRSLFRKL